MAGLFSGKSVRAVLVGLIFATPSLAAHIEPAKASKASFELVNAYAPCFAPNTVTQTGGFPACAPAVPDGGSGCAFGATGQGKLTLAKTGNATSGTQDLKVSVAAKGLNAACEGLTLEVRLSFRLTTDDCPAGSCTAPDLQDYGVFGGSCTVVGGQCKIKTTLIPGLIATNGKNAGIEILGCGLHGPLFIAFPPEIRCGVVLK